MHTNRCLNSDEFKLPQIGLIIYLQAGRKKNRGAHLIRVFLFNPKVIVQYPVKYAEPGLPWPQNLFIAVFPSEIWLVGLCVHIFSFQLEMQFGFLCQLPTAAVVVYASIRS